MDSWERFNQISLPNKEDFYSSLNMEDITDADDIHGKRVFKIFNNKNLGDYHDLYAQSGILLLSDVFENFSMASMLKENRNKIRIANRY